MNRTLRRAWDRATIAGVKLLQPQRRMPNRTPVISAFHSQWDATGRLWISLQARIRGKRTPVRRFFEECFPIICVVRKDLVARVGDANKEGQSAKDTTTRLQRIAEDGPDLIARFSKTSPGSNGTG